MLTIVFDSQGVVLKQFVPEWKTGNAEFYEYNGVMDRLLKRIQQIRPAAFCSRDCFLLHDNAPAHTALPVFDPKKCYNPLSPPVLSRFMSAILLSVPQVENEVKRTPLCGCCWDPRSRNWRIKEGKKKRNFRQLFRHCTTAQKPVYRVFHDFRA